MRDGTQAGSWRAGSLALALGLGLAACRSTPPGEAFAPEPLEPGEGVVYVFRPAQRLGMRRVEVSVDGAVVAHLRAGQFTARALAPGEHFVRVRARGEVVERVELEPGDSVYLRVVGRALMGPAAGLEEVESGVARELIARTTRAE